MKTPVVFLFILGLTFARGDSVPNKNSQNEPKNGHQGTEPTGLETASTRNAHIQYQGNRMENVHNQEQKYTQHSQLQNSQSVIQHQNAPFHGQNQGSQVHGQDLTQQFHSQNQATQFHSQNQAPQLYSQNQAPQFHSQNQAPQFHSQNQAPQFHSQNQGQQFHSQNQGQQFHSQNQAQQFHSQNQAQQFHSQNQAQQFPNQGQVQQFSNQGQVQQFHNQGLIAAGAPVHSDQEIANLLHSQQHITPAAISVIQAQSKEQVRDFSAQQVYSGNVHPDQELHQERRGVMDVQEKTSERRVGDSTGQQGQVLRGVKSSEIRASGFPPIYLPRSAFDNREQPLVLPGVSQTHSTSVVVSGLKNLPVLPGLVYTAAPVPANHAVAYSRPWFQGGAYVKQHWQTPYARYVYSHIL